jgi:hypothetical protein
MNDQLNTNEQQLMNDAPHACHACPLAALSTEIIDRLSRIDANQQTIMKTLNGNGKPGLIQRVEELEAVTNTTKGVHFVMNRVLAVMFSGVLALLSASVSLAVIHNNNEEAAVAANVAYQQRQDAQIQQVQADVLIIKQQLARKK